jgi:hypothetical protein
MNETADRTTTQDPRIVTSQEAREIVDEGGFGVSFTEVLALAHTVATEPDRIRAAFVKALQHASQWVPKSADRDALADYINAIKNGADW